MSYPLPDFLPGTLTLAPGSARDYRQLEQFHYLPKRPATWADVWSIRFRPRDAPEDGDGRVVAVGVLSYPVPSCRPRERFLGRLGLSRSENLRFANQHVRTISRVIVHPQFRSLGLSSVLVRCLCDSCTTRYVESIAMMARAHPFFDRAGMTRIEPEHEDEPVYFILDRQSHFLSPVHGTSAISVEPGEGQSGGELQ
jgi:hypothetical protein